MNPIELDCYNYIDVFDSTVDNIWRCLEKVTDSEALYEILIYIKNKNRELINDSINLINSIKNNLRTIL